MSFLSLYARVLRQLSAAKGVAVALVIANLGLAAAQFAEPVLFGRIVDRLADAQRAGAAPRWLDILPLLAAWVVFALFTIGAGVLVALHADRLAHRQRLSAMAAYFDHVLHLPTGFHAGAHSGRLLKVMIEGATAQMALWQSFLREHCAGFVALTILLPMTLLINARLGAMLLALVVAFGLMMNFVLRKTQGLQGSVDRLHSDLAERVSDVLGNVPVIQSFTRIEEEARALRSLIDRVLGAQLPVLSWWAVAAVATRASATLTLLAIFVTGIWLDIEGLATIGEIVTFMSLATTLIGRLEQNVAFVNMTVTQAPKLAQFFEVLDTHSNVAERPGAVDVGRLTGKVSFDHVSFAYAGAQAAVSDVSFTAEAGRTIALVGATGSGKSTTLSLLHRVFDPQKGAILIDGLDIRDMTLQSLRNNIGVVFQEPFLFARSIEENLRIGKPDASAAEIAAALDRAQASAFVAGQPMGLATPVGERGRNLSGGERQRLAIARALLKDPPIMILDEATSALDANTERQLQEALEAAMHGRTTLIIAHRLATIRRADQILVFDHGRVVEAGSFDDLIARQGLFSSLARAQFIASEAAAPDQLPA
ncbi:glucan ABC transporter ATP-binding protein/ permease [Methylocapsa sp. S129]|uniref:glucan ABC transporter ATP-binding protein/ permease n=1 Tax=Methylocapsa sp. S129 TaxID=1641869 RepID=UPI00131A7991|nr:glucan ABC transporter ATP-binding protein/ permease [Methylocapsa sp. S129]